MRQECLSVCLSRRLIAAAAVGGFAAEVRRGQQISIDDSTAAAAQHAGRVNFGPTVRRSNILFIVVYTVDKY